MKVFARIAFIIGITLLFIAVAGLEGDFTLGQGMSVGIIGSITSLATMKNTGWFYK